MGKSLVYKTKKELISSAGAIDSPKLLMLSGIGPKEELKKQSIPIVKDLPVGKYLEDHIFVPLNYYTDYPGLTGSGLSLIDPWEYFKLFFIGGSKLSDNIIGVNGFLHTEVNKDKLNRPDLQVHTGTVNTDVDYGVRLYKSLSQDKTVFNHIMEPFLGKYYTASIYPTLLRPKSQGRIKLQSNNYLDDPILELNYLDHQDDVNLLVEGVKFALSLQDTEAFKKHNLKPFHPDTMHCGDYEPYSKEYLECYVRHFATTVYHPSCTARMGSDSKTSVVDSRLRVHGIQGLRVIDTSIMPKLVGGNTNAPTIMIGEKGADLVLEDWNLIPKSKKEKKTKDEL